MPFFATHESAGICFQPSKLLPSKMRVTPAGSGASGGGLIASSVGAVVGASAALRWVEQISKPIRPTFKIVRIDRILPHEAPPKQSSVARHDPNKYRLNNSE